MEVYKPAAEVLQILKPFIMGALEKTRTCPDKHKQRIKKAYGDVIEETYVLLRSEKC